MKKTWFVTPVILVLIAALIAITICSLFFNVTLFIVQAAVVIPVCCFAVIRLILMKNTLKRYLVSVADIFEKSRRYSLSNFALPLVVISEQGEIVWYNLNFENEVLQGSSKLGDNIADIIKTPGLDVIVSAQMFEISLGGRDYSVYSNKMIENGKKIISLFFVDDTEYKQIIKEYELSRPVVMLIVFDNFDEMVQNAKESEQVQISGAVQSILETYVAGTTGFLKSLARDRFLLITDERDLKRIIERQFDILDIVHNVVNADNMSSTLSIGVGRGKDLFECEHNASIALDMALGRGGDQAAVKTENGFEFYGGTLRGVEKRTRIRSRVIANALTELVKGVDNVLIMGHAYADLDCIGAAVGMLKAVKSLGKPAHIVIRPSKSVAAPLMERLIGQGNKDAILPPDKALDKVNDNTLLIVVDTHHPSMLESEQVYRACKQVVVIDHHRKMVEHIDNAVIFFHEPYASSTSEMVTELLQHIRQVQIGRSEGEALLAGIMLDTKNFVIRTGVRTFEAAAWLRKKGADTIEVKRMFSSTLSVYQKKADLVSAAEIYKGCAISMCEGKGEEVRLAVAQAADELLTIKGVIASFVMCLEGDIVNISARSMDKLNVQLVMEALGGGGHYTMAAAQLEGVTLKQAREQLIKAIDEIQ